MKTDNYPNCADFFVNVYTFDGSSFQHCNLNAYKSKDLNEFLKSLDVNCYYSVSKLLNTYTVDILKVVNNV